MLALALMVSALYLVVNKPATWVISKRESRDCLRCHAELIPSFDSKATHYPFDRKACTMCHTKHGETEISQIKKEESGSTTSAKEKDEYEGYLTRFKAPKPRVKSKLKTSIEKLCVNECHQESVSIQDGKKYKMPPFEKRKCLSCHDPHASKYVNLTVAPIRTMCLSCHPKIAEYYNKNVLHPPFKLGVCTSCHKPHASNFKPMLRAERNILCPSCHPKIAKLKLKPTKMEPFEKGECTVCHNPHGSNNEKMFQAPIPTLCFRCHKGIEEFQKKAVMMPPFREGKCLNCHFGMAGDNPKLLRAPLEGNKICFRCHGEKEENFKGIGHSKVVRNASPYQPEGGVGSCLNCHEPHGSNYARLLQMEQISLCLSCHGPRRYFAHPIGFKWTDPWHGGYLRCGSCHDPMGSGLFKLKRPPNEELPPMAEGQIDPSDGLCTSCHNPKDPTWMYFSPNKWHTYQVPDAEGGAPEPPED